LNDSIRCFIAIELPIAAQKMIETITCELQKVVKSGFRWIPIHNIHLTLKFLGDVQKSNLLQIYDLINQSASLYPDFSLTIGKLGVFPNPQKPRIVWIGVQAPSELFDLQKLIDIQAEIIGIPKELRLFTPHLTLARSKEITHFEEIKALGNAIAHHNRSPQSISISVSKLTLFQSDLKPGGARYTQIVGAGLKTRFK
jgi:2'-5' RNA ligase